MAKKSAKQSEILPKRRRYDPEKDPEKVIADTKVLFASMRHRQYLPSPTDLYRSGYENLSFAIRRIGYHAAAHTAEIPPDPDYYSNIDNLDDEITRLFIDPQWKALKDDEYRSFEPKLPSYEELRRHPELFKGVVIVGGISKICPPKAHYMALNPSYYLDDSNLRTELEIWMPRLRTKLMPTYAQIELRNELIPDAYLVRGGYLKAAEKLGLAPSKTYLRDPGNLKHELRLVEIAQALKEGERILDSGLPDCYSMMMPDESEIRAIRRTDLHRAIEALGGYHYVSEKQTCGCMPPFGRTIQASSM